LLLGLIFLAGVSLPLFEALDESFWADEIVTRNASRQALDGVFAWVAQNSVHPPLYYFGVNLWTKLAGLSETSLRLYNLPWTALLLGLGWLWGRRIGGVPAGLAAAALLALSPRALLIAADARMYAQAAALGLLSAYLLLRWMEAAEPARRRPFLLAYAACAFALAGSHYVAASILVAEGLLVLFHFRRQLRRLLEFALALAPAALGFLAWSFYVFRSKGGTLVGSDMDWVAFRPLDFLSFPVVQYGFPLAAHGVLGATGSPADAIVPAALFAKLAFAALLLGLLATLPFFRPGGVNAPVRSRWGGGALLLFLAPPLIMLLVSLAYQPVFYAPRSSAFVLPFFLLSLVFLIFRLPARALRLALCGGLVLFFAWGSSLVLTTRQKDDVGRQAAALLKEQPVDASLVGNPGTVFFYQYALPEEARLLDWKALPVLLHPDREAPLTVAIFVPLDSRVNYREWFRFPEMRRLVDRASKIRQGELSSGSRLILLTLPPASPPPAVRETDAPPREDPTTASPRVSRGTSS